MKRSFSVIQKQVSRQSRCFSPTKFTLAPLVSSRTLTVTSSPVATTSAFRSQSFLNAATPNAFRSQCLNFSTDTESQIDCETESGGESSAEASSSATETEESDDEFDWGYETDEDLTKSLSFDVRSDPFWKQMAPAKKKMYLYGQRHKTAEVWDEIKEEYGDKAPWNIGQIPTAVTTSRFNVSTIRAVKRFPELGKYAQRSSHLGGRTKQLTRIEENRVNTAATLERGVYYKQPPNKGLLKMLNVRQRERYWNPRVDYSVRAGDLIKLRMFTNLQKQKTQKIVALCLMVRNKGHHFAGLIIRNVEKDGLAIIRQYPLWSPWIRSLKIIKRYKVPRRRLYYMYKAPATEIDPQKYAEKIGARNRRAHFEWLFETEEGRAFARDERLKRKMNFLGMRKRKPWAKKLADLYAATAIASNVKGPYRNALRERKYRLQLHPYHIDQIPRKEPNRGRR